EGLDAQRNRILLRDADASNGATAASDLQSRDRRLFEPHALENGMRSKAVGELVDEFDGRVASLAHDICRPELFGQRGSTGMATEDDDSLRAEPPCGDHSAQPDGPIADDGD